MSPRRPFFVWLGDVGCGLLAYVLSRWIWKSVGTGPFDQLFEELATFVGVFLVAKLLLKLLGRKRADPA